MISIEAYRVSIGNFNGTRQFDLRSIYRHLRVNSSNSSKGISRFLKPCPFLALVLLSCIILLQSGDIETNPGPVNIFKVVKASTHQGNAAVFGQTAGSQCMFMSISAIVYSHVKSLCYWGQNDLDAILRIGNDLYGSFGYIDNFLDLRELPPQIQIQNNVIEFERTNPIVSALSVESRNIINIPAGYNCGIFLAGSSGTAFIFHNASYYLFDSHSRNEEGMLGGNTGTSVLLAFRTKFDLEEYIKAYHLDQFSNEYVGTEVQYVRLLFTEQSVQNLKSHFRNLIGTFRKREASIKFSANLTPEKRAKINEKSRTGMASFRANLTPEKRIKINEKNRTGKASFRANLTPEKKAANQEKQNVRRSANRSINKTSTSRIETFKAEIRKGPYYICVICNR